VYDVYARTLANVNVGCVMIMHMHWLTLIQNALNFLGWFSSK